MAKKTETSEKIIIQKEPEERGYEVVPTSGSTSNTNIEEKEKEKTKIDELTKKAEEKEKELKPQDLENLRKDEGLKGKEEFKFNPKKIQKGEAWVDEKGNCVAKKRVFLFEVNAERNAVKIYNDAIKTQAFLEKLYKLFTQGTNKIQAFEDEKTKKSFTFYSFDKSIKVEKLVQYLPEYDNEKIKSAKKKFDLYINKYKKDKTEDGFEIIDLIKSAFETKSGKFDKTKLNILIGHKNIKDETFQKAVEELEGAIQTNREKIYYNVYVKNDDNEYIQVNLRLSGVK